jgi:hypothetical protein
MKTTITSLLVVASMATAYAQKTDKNSFKYEIELTPKNLISKTKNVDIEISSNYSDLTESRKAEVEKLKAQEASKKLGTKMFEKAISNTVFDPKNPTAESIFVPTLVGEETVIRIKVPGFTENNSSQGKIKIVFHSLRIINETTASFDYTPLLADVTIINDKGVTIYSGVIGEIKGAINYTIPTGEKRQASYMKAEQKAKDETIEMINKMLKDDFGYLSLKDERVFFDIKDKKFQYPEMHLALEKVKTALTYINIDSKKQEVENLFKDALKIWEDAIKTVDKQSKDAKINKDNAAALYLNIAEANIWLHDFEKSKIAIAEHKLLGEDYSKTLSNEEKFLTDYSTRFNSWTNY